MAAAPCGWYNSQFNVDFDWDLPVKNLGRKRFALRAVIGAQPGNRGPNDRKLNA
jgi:hypothetical protein